MNITTGSRVSKVGWIGLGIASIGFLIVGIVFLIMHRKNEQKQIPSPPTPITPQRHKPSIEEQKQIFAEIFQKALDLGYNTDVSKAIAGQSAHETGRWSSELAQDYQNIFGMKSGGAGKGIQSGEKSGFAVYRTWDDSLNDVDQWMRAKNYPFDQNLNSEQHLQWLKSKQYFTDSLSNYRNSVLSLINELGGIINA